MVGELMILLDTCALLWWTFSPERLSAVALKACQNIRHSGGYISSVSIWEIGIKVKKGRLELKLSLPDLVVQLQSAQELEILPVDEMIWLENLALDWDHPDPVDRTIVATAQLRRLPLVTADHVIRRFYRKAIW